MPPAPSVRTRRPPLRWVACWTRMAGGGSIASTQSPLREMPCPSRMTTWNRRRECWRRRAPAPCFRSRSVHGAVGQTVSAELCQCLVLLEQQRPGDSAPRIRGPARHPAGGPDAAHPIWLPHSSQGMDCGQCGHWMCPTAGCWQPVRSPVLTPTTRWSKTSACLTAMGLNAATMGVGN